MNWLIRCGIRGAWCGNLWKSRATSPVLILWQREAGDRHYPGRQESVWTPAGRSLCNNESCLAEGLFACTSLKDVCTTLRVWALGLPGCSLAAQDLWFPISKGWGEIVSRSLTFGEEEAVASKLSWRKLLILSEFISSNPRKPGLLLEQPQIWILGFSFPFFSVPGHLLLECHAGYSQHCWGLVTWLELLFYKEEPADVPVLATVGRTLPLVGFSWTLGNGGRWVEVTQAVTGPRP